MTNHQLSEMANFSTHILSSYDGTHLSKVGVSLYSVKMSGDRLLKFEDVTDNGGRLKASFEITEFDLSNYFEVCFDTSAIFDDHKLIDVKQVSKVCCICLRLVFNDPKGDYHVPVILSRYGASFWVSS